VQTTDAQVRRLMEEMQKHAGMGLAAMRAGMGRKTARKYVRAGLLPSELRKPHTWRTRADPFAEDWPALTAMLEEAPELEARTLFDHLVGLKPDAYAAGQLRTLQRRVREWRAQRGPEREIFFPQAHRPGEALQTDFTHATVLGVRIGGELFAHQLRSPVGAGRRRGRIPPPSPSPPPSRRATASAAGRLRGRACRRRRRVRRGHLRLLARAWKSER